MMMPVYPGAPWLPKFKGHGEDLKYCDWKEQITGLLGTQELAEPRKVDIVLGALAGEAKRQVSVLEEKEKDQVRKILNYLDSLYGDRTPTSVLRSQFFGCTQKPSETVSSFILRLRELHCRLRRHDPDDSPSDVALRDQLLLGLLEGPLAQALKVNARRNPEEDFAAIRQEALLLDAEYGNTPTEATCSAVSNPCASPKSSQGPGWKEALKKEIMEDVKAQMGELTQELVREVKSLLQPAAVAPQPPRFERERRRSTSYANDRDAQGRPICHRCRRPGHIARFCREPNASPPPLN
uniref:CCHC-type domain-containing protein n=2 Tax=Nothobranchius TaxID=28779 RepID=A0A1A8HIY2_9TELE